MQLRNGFEGLIAHMSELRKVGKEILKDIWLVARGTKRSSEPTEVASSVSPADSRVVVG